MRALTSIALAAALTASSAFAGETGSLPSGKPAGVQQAQLQGNGVLIVLGLAIAAGGIALVCSEGSGNNITTSTSGTTSTGSTTTTTTTTTTTV